MFSEDQVIHIFGVVDEFTLEFDKYVDKYSIGYKAKRKPRMSNSEVMTIMILFQLSGIRCFKWYYTHFVQKHLCMDFPSSLFELIRDFISTSKVSTNFINTSNLG